MTRVGQGTRKLRDYTLISYYALLIMWPLGMAGMVADQPWVNWWTGAFLASQAVEALTAVLALHHWTNQILEGRPGPRWLAPLLAVSTLASLVCAVMGLPTDHVPMSPVALALGVTLFGALLALSPFFNVSKALLATFSASAVHLLAGMIALWVHPVDSRAPDEVLALAGTVPVGIGLLVIMPTQVWFYNVLRSVGAQERLDAMRADLAVAEERLRIARDLHDVFGRALTAVAVKSDLAAALADAEGAPRAASESRRVKALADDALKEVRAVLADYRRPDLASELVGANSFLASAGITCRVIGDAHLPDWAAEPLAMVLREAVTNVVRHSDASMCTIRVSYDEGGAGLEITNDRAHAPSPQMSGEEGQTPSSGLESLSARLASVGGTLKIRGHGGSFTISVRIPAPSEGEPR
ncbi:two-component sensor histidine kinase [Schaalia sp. 19OD2882]|uniref:sensor histidine kinase n=1 Tax=Schaalia sp. 19OD2882 TaxID=2794089 RepID=UPI001C1ED7D2|nr:histidine kinase [Schaalia sp. 19OD2882]QWW19707.1 two-component sensor histidine kinase [Schaalia sp. 19OD2882]